MNAVLAHLDQALDRVLRARDPLLTDPDAPCRAERLARLYSAEAQAWSQLFELAADRPTWRAALVAEQIARRHAAAWARRATTERPAPVAARPDRGLVTVGER